MIKKTLYIFLVLIVVVIVLYNGVSFYVDKNIIRNDYSGVYDSCYKVWSARGIYENVEEQNSLKSLRRAFSVGYEGAEIDLYYDVESNRFVISHDRPKKSKNGKLLYSKKEGSILTLEQVFKRLGEDHYFWLDYKNLDRLSEENTNKAIARLLEISADNAIRERFYIEGSNPFILTKYTTAGFKTIFGIHPSYESKSYSSIALNIYKIAFYFNDISAFAISYGLLDDPIYGMNTQQSLKGLPVFLFHVPDNEALINELIAKQEVRMLLAGRDLSLDRAYLNVCP